MHLKKYHDVSIHAVLPVSKQAPIPEVAPMRGISRQKPQVMPSLSHTFANVAFCKTLFKDTVSEKLRKLMKLCSTFGLMTQLGPQALRQPHVLRDYYIVLTSQFQRMS